MKRGFRPGPLRGGRSGGLVTGVRIHRLTSTVRKSPRASAMPCRAIVRQFSRRMPVTDLVRLQDRLITRLVATGCFRTNSRFAVNIQQKYREGSQHERRSGGSRRVRGRRHRDVPAQTRTLPPREPQEPTPQASHHAVDARGLGEIATDSAAAKASSYVRPSR